VEPRSRAMLQWLDENRIRVGSIYVVRHGQAAFGTDDYDRLTEVGFTQARLLGAHFARGASGSTRSSPALCGGRSRRRRAIVEGHPQLGAGPCRRSAFPDSMNTTPRPYWKRISGSCRRWAAARLPGAIPRWCASIFACCARRCWLGPTIDSSRQGMAAFSKFQEQAVAALIAARTRFPDGRVLLVSSGGPIAAMVAAALNAPPAAAVELNLRIRNTR
jgi:broad specificity phosphatase PhoE